MTRVGTDHAGRMPEVIVIGAMKCATSAMHHYLDVHPEISMASAKELNFFSGPEDPPDADPQEWWRWGQWHRGPDWYADQFDPDAPVRGEASPAYTAPSSPHAPDRMAATVPEARLFYLVRDPVERAVSQYAHHRRDGTEQRPLEQAVLDPGSEYLERSRYHRRLVPFLQRFPREQVKVVVQERLRERRGAELADIYAHAGVDPEWRDPRQHEDVHVAPSSCPVPDRLRAAVWEQVGDDVERLRELLDDDLPEWAR
jgi:hypothetical protein